MAAELKEQHKTLLDRLAELRSEFGLYVQRLLTYEYDGENGAVRMKEIMSLLRGPLAEIPDARLSVSERTDYLHDETGLPKSNVLSFFLNDTEKVIIRPSGTEPKLKAYLFTRAESESEANDKLDSLQRIVDHICK